MARRTRADRGDSDGRGDPGGLRLAPATRLLWRARNSVQLEMGDRAMIVDGLPPATIAAFTARPRSDGSAPAAVPAGGEEHAALAELTGSGFVWQRSAAEGSAAPDAPVDLRRTPPTPRLAGELAALSARAGERASELLSARRQASVVVHGRHAAAIQLATVLAAAGVGRVRCTATGSARLAHAAPGGIGPGDEGRDLATAAEAALRRAAPGVDTTPLPLDDVADLTILAGGRPVDDDRRAALHAANAAHLAMSVSAYSGVVGPLVLPGLTSCLRCADLHRRDRDPAWPTLAVQLTVAREQPAELAVATTIVGVAAIQTLAFLDGDEPACIDGTLEVHLPDWRVRRRSWPPHPECGCGPAAAR